MLSHHNRTEFATLLEAYAFDDDEAIAITFVATGAEPVKVTRQQFRQRALQIGAGLQQKGIIPGDIVIIASQNILDTTFAFYAVMSIGATPSILPPLTEKLDPQIYKRNLKTLVKRSQVKAIITDDEFAPQITELPCLIITASTGSQPTQIQPANADDIAFLQHSSGTTGLQKGIALSHRAVLNQLAAYSDALALSTDDVIVSWLPLYHDMGLIAGFLLPVVQGVSLVLMSPFDWIAHPVLLLKTIDTYGGTLCWLPNFAYNHMARRIRLRDKEDLSLATMRAFINCSEPVRNDSHHAFLQAFPDTHLSANQLAVSYAMAENTFAVTQTPIGQQPQVDRINRDKLEQQQIAEPDANGVEMVSCGQTINGTQIRIVDDTFYDLPERHIGQILVQSDCMLTEYYHRPDLQPFMDDWYQTGDTGYIADGALYVIGRQKDIIITAGKNVYPQDIEAIVNTVAGVHQGRCVVFGVFDEREGTERIAVIVERDQQIQIDDNLLKKHIRQQIAKQTTVAATYITLVDTRWLIKTSSGKIARNANRQKWLTEFVLS